MSELNVSNIPDSYIYKILISLSSETIDKIYCIITNIKYSTNTYDTKKFIIKQLNNNNFFDNDLDQKLLNNGIIEFLEEKTQENDEILTFINENKDW